MSAESERLANVKNICARLSITAIAPQIKACEKLLSADAAVNVAVLGKFKAGKSSFLNCLAGKEALPTGAVPVTAVITELFWGPEENVSVQFLDGKEERITLEGAEYFIKEELNPKNRRGAALVKIALPSLAAYKGARFVDTPGLDSALRHNTETSLDWLPNTGLALIAVSADAPLSEQDLALIAETRKHSPQIVVLLTKADRLSPLELEQVLAYVRGEVKTRLGGEIPVYPFSIRAEFPGLREEFARRVLFPFSADIAASRARILGHKINSLERQCLAYLLAAKAAAEKEAQEREKLKALAVEQKARTESLKRDFKAIFARTSEFCRQEIEKLVLAHKPALQKELSEALPGKLSHKRMNLLEMTRTYSAELETFFSDKTGVLFEKEKHRFEKLARDSAGSFTAMANDFSASLSLEAEKALGARLPQNRLEPRPEKIPAPDVKISQAFDSHLELLWFLIPAGLLRKILIKYYLGLVPFETEKNLTRLAMGLSAAMDQWTESSMKAALEHVNAVQNTVESLLAASPDSLAEIERAVAKLSPVKEA